MLKLSSFTLSKNTLHSSIPALQRYISVQHERIAPRYTIRYMREQDIPQVKELRRVNNFYDATSTYSNLLKIDPKCFTVAEAENGMIISLIGFKKITTNTYFVGFRVTHKDYRMKGISVEMFKHSFDNHRNCNLVGLTDIGLSRKNLKFNYLVSTNSVNIDYEYDTVIDHNLLSSEVPQNVYLNEYQDSYLGAILDYDSSVVDYKREQLVTLNCQDKDSRTFVATKGGICVGYGTIKPTIQGCGKIGPLYAENPVIAEAILKNLLVSFNVKKGLAAQTLSCNFYANMIFGTLETSQKNVVINYNIYYKKQKFMNETKKTYAVFDGEYEPF